ncbi:hypothetical protein CXZ10_20395 [Pleomorphomonas diazotrophica]|uniref:Uncharacterized protein n=1 Tax=Pleomorphomonas diazotrophica TaxID=1166257 RepID=A0A1I4V6S4_9HYPH|nr:hypothetical protein [Pleomorphomonas diazotrophica]PKR87407.1 hypothetical protein CXZ10_20395 [Pleomorphomonas diazotrophica]SFM96680.1 hypothetical protein SAMN05192571_110104 [Pleomorphomonas diazotrophica]
MKDYSPAQIKTGFRISLALLFILSLVGNLTVKLHRGDQVGYYPGAYGGWIGELLGETSVSFIAAIIFFGIVRMVRKTKTPTAGLIAGIVVTLILCAMLYQEASLELSGAIPS